MKRALLAGLVLAVAGCSKCGKKVTTAAGQPELVRYLPKTADVAVVIPDVGELGQRITRLEQKKFVSFAAQLQGFPNGQALVSELMRQIGIDFRDRGAIE